jgi:hypothetical protein
VRDGADSSRLSSDRPLYIREEEEEEEGGGGEGRGGEGGGRGGGGEGGGRGGGEEEEEEGRTNIALLYKLIFLLRTREVPGSNTCPEIDYYFD